MNVLSLFDGISCGRLALERAGIPVTNYFASEIDKFAVKVSKDNWPDAHRLGDVHKVSFKDGILYGEDFEMEIGQIDLILAGSPCQSISNLGDGTGLAGKSGLFYEFFRILFEVRAHNPDVKFILENVQGKKEAVDTISKDMGVEPVLIDSKHFTPQTRKRLYWTNIEVAPIPENNTTRLQNILEPGIPESSVISEGRVKWLMEGKGQKALAKRYATLDPERAGCLTARSDASWNSNYVTREGQITRLSPVEYERLQTLPDGYTACISNSQRFKSIGNGWTVDVIAHILKGLNHQ